MARPSSPAPGRSTLMTSAPRSARIMLAAGPATMVLRSRTRIPERTDGISLCSQKSAGFFDLLKGRPAAASIDAEFEQGLLQRRQLKGRLRIDRCEPFHS